MQELPPVASADENKIYIVPKDGGTAPNVYEEWYVENGAWEKVGEDTIDLSNYYNKTETDALLDDKQDALTPGQNVQISNNVISATDTTYNDATQSDAGLMSAADKTKLDGIEAGAEANQNAYSTVKVGNVSINAGSESDTIELIAGTGITLTPDATNKTVTVSVSLTKQNILDILGAEEVTISKTDASGTVSGYFLGSVSQS